MEDTMRAADVMARAVVTVHPGARIVDAIRLMLDQRISGLPVIDSAGELVGILTEGDLLRRAETGTERRRPAWIEFLRGPGQQADDYVHAHGRRVEDIMTRQVATVSEGTPLEEVVGLMERKRVRQVPVLSAERLAGIVSRADLLRALFTNSGSECPGADRRCGSPGASHRGAAAPELGRSFASIGRRGGRRRLPRRLHL